MLGLLPLAGLLFLSGEFKAYGTGAAELRVGQAPVTAGEDPEAGVAAAIAPVGELEYVRPDRQILLDYGPRILWRQPNALHNHKPLILHVVNLAVTLDVTPNVRLIERGSASYGEADYVALAQIFTTSQGAIPQVANIFAVAAGTGLRWDANRVWRYESMFDVEHRQVLGGADEVQADPLVPPSFRQTNLEFDSSGIARITRRNDLVLTAAVSDRSLHNGVDIFGVTPQVGWRTRFARFSELRFAAGVTYLRDRGSEKLIGTEGIVRPVGDVELSGLLLARRQVAWRGTVAATVDYFVDPFLRAVGPRAVLAARSVLLFEPAWTVGVESSFATSLRGTPPPALGSNLPPDETTIAVALPVRHRASQNYIVETGLRWSVRAPRIRADNLDFHERQIWLYVALTGTTRRVDEWVAPREEPSDAGDEGAFARPQTSDSLSRHSLESTEQADGVRPPTPQVTGGTVPAPANSDTDTTSLPASEAGGVTPANAGP